MTTAPGVQASAGVATAAACVVLVFYLACVGWHVGLQGGGALLIHAGILFHVFGAGFVSPWLVALGELLMILRTSTAGMVAFAALVATATAVAWWRRPPPAPKVRSSRPVALAIAAALAFAADARLGITPLGAALAPPLTEPSGVVATRRFDVDRFAEEVQDRDVGSVAEVTGVLAYLPSMGRYELRSSQPGKPGVYLFVQAGRESLFNERPARAGPDPRVVAHLQPMLGKRVTATGRISRSQVSAQARDIRPAAAQLVAE